MTSKQKVLVTGAGGFIGHHLTKYLVDRGYWVRGVDLKMPEYEPSAANVWLNAILEFVTSVIYPYLNLFRRFLPLVRIGPGALDISPIVAILALSILGSVVVRLIHG